MEGLEMERKEIGRLKREGAQCIDFSLFKPNLINM
jgi:hypothetical protein